MKAIALLSGGLDSTLAAKLLLEQGIELEAVNFQTIFLHCPSCKSAADQLGIKLKVFEISKEYLEIVKNPGHGYGRNLNPCIDCRIFMFKKAGEYMQESRASFIVTGEVLGERPMSQRMEAIRLIERESLLDGLILRPLSARLFPLTIPEKKRWVDREKLLGIKGRSRGPQIKLAEELGITDYPCPAGGCLLTDKGFSLRMRDLMTHNRGFTVKDVKLLKIGRLFRLTPMAKLIVGRNEKENERLSAMAREFHLYFTPQNVMGPAGLGIGLFGKDELLLSSRIISRYSDRNGKESIEVICRDKKILSSVPSISVTMTASPIEEESLASLRI